MGRWSQFVKRIVPRKTKRKTKQTKQTLTVSRVEETEEAKKLVAFRGLVDALPRQQAVVLDWVIAFIRRVAQGSEITKMTAKNIACLIAPNVIYRSNSAPPSVEDGSHPPPQKKKKKKANLKKTKKKKTKKKNNLEPKTNTSL